MLRLVSSHVPARAACARCFSASIDPSALQIERTTAPKAKMPKEELAFGACFVEARIQVVENLVRTVAAEWYTTGCVRACMQAEGRESPSISAKNCVSLTCQVLSNQ